MQFLCTFSFDRATIVNNYFLEGDDISFGGDMIEACAFVQKHIHTRDDSHVTQGAAKEIQLLLFLSVHLMQTK